jgi:hypothetical protein
MTTPTKALIGISIVVLTAAVGFGVLRFQHAEENLAAIVPTPANPPVTLTCVEAGDPYPDMYTFVMDIDNKIMVKVSFSIPQGSMENYSYNIIWSDSGKWPLTVTETLIMWSGRGGNFHLDRNTLQMTVIHSSSDASQWQCRLARRQL